jgi:pyroglutamyl-peptidase
MVVHVGLDADRSYFAIEMGADRDGYHQVPDEARKVFWKMARGKSPDRLDSSIGIDDVVSRRRRLKKGADLRVGDDVGDYVCGFAYYLTLEKFWKAGASRPVLFFHVPPPSKRDIEEGVEIAIALIQAVVGSIGDKRPPNDYSMYHSRQHPPTIFLA